VSVSAYDNVKVWTVDPAPKVRPRPSSTRGKLRIETGARRHEDTRERAERNERLSVYARLAVVAILGGAILWWPYVRSCGFGLALYLAATAMIVVGGLWVVVCTWTCRMARTHALAMLVALWGAGLIAVEVLPRIGYARHPAAWLCGAAPARAAP
jgi:hypothetical protein